jgi:hypothetical protein
MELVGTRALGARRASEFFEFIDQVSQGITGSNPATIQIMQLPCVDAFFAGSSARVNVNHHVVQFLLPYAKSTGH